LRQAFNKSIWIVRAAHLPTELRNQGVGTVAYKMMAKAAEDNRAILAPLINVLYEQRGYFPRCFESVESS